MSKEQNEIQLKKLIRHSILDYLEGETDLSPDVWTEVSYELTETIYDAISEQLAGNKANQEE